jgi:hypothetical protein
MGKITKILSFTVFHIRFVMVIELSFAHYSFPLFVLRFIQVLNNLAQIVVISFEFLLSFTLKIQTV